MQTFKREAPHSPNPHILQQEWRDTAYLWMLRLNMIKKHNSNGIDKMTQNSQRSIKNENNLPKGKP